MAVRNAQAEWVAFFNVASPSTLASLVADFGSVSPAHPESPMAILRDEVLEVLIANVGEAEAHKLIDAASGVRLSPVEMFEQALSRLNLGWLVTISHDKADVVVRTGLRGAEPVADVVASKLEAAGFDEATFEAVNLCDGVVVVTPLVG